MKNEFVKQVMVKWQIHINEQYLNLLRLIKQNLEFDYIWTMPHIFITVR